jgi:hypothetical protein
LGFKLVLADYALVRLLVTSHAILQFACTFGKEARDLIIAWRGEYEAGRMRQANALAWSKKMVRSHG